LVAVIMLLGLINSSKITSESVTFDPDALETAVQQAYIAHTLTAQVEKHKDDLQLPAITQTKKPTEEATSTPTLTLTNSPFPTSSFTPTLTFTPQLGVGSTQVSSIDGMLQVYIPAGEAYLGNDTDGYEIVFLEAFWIDQTEVTNTKFSSFLNDLGNQYEGKRPVRRGSWRGVDVAWLNTNAFGYIENEEDYWYPKEGFEEHPVIEVTWYGARAYCEWANRRLPTAAEWEKAARGGLEGKKFPWGDDEPVCEPGAINGAQYYNCKNGAVSVKTFSPNGFGIYDMSGNVLEWVIDAAISDTQRVVRGGAFYSLGIEKSIQVFWGGTLAPYSSNSFTGFRCAMDASP